MGSGKYIGAVTQMRTAPLCFIVVISIILFRVGLCSHTFLICGQCGDITSGGSYLEASIAWTRVHAIINQCTCAKPYLSEMDRRLNWRCVEASRCFNQRLDDWGLIVDLTNRASCLGWACDVDAKVRHNHSKFLR